MCILLPCKKQTQKKDKSFIGKLDVVHFFSNLRNHLFPKEQLILIKMGYSQVLRLLFPSVYDCGAGEVDIS